MTRDATRALPRAAEQEVRNVRPHDLGCVGLDLGGHDAAGTGGCHAAPRVLVGLGSGGEGETDICPGAGLGRFWRNTSTSL